VTRGELTMLQVGIIFGAAGMMLLVSLAPEIVKYKHARKLRKIREGGL
jgi:hypothetical protein